MTRKTMYLAYISNDSARKVTYNNRKKDLVKKASELTTPCRVEACVVIYPPGSASQSEVWPSTAKVNRLLSEFKELPTVAQNDKMVNSECLLRQTLAKANEKLKKQCEDNRQKELSRVMFKNLRGEKGLQCLKTKDLKDLWWLIDQNLKDNDKRIETLTKAISP